MEPYLTETHFHTSETSVCGKIPAAEGIALCRERGYAAVIVTDHYVQAFFAEREALSEAEPAFEALYGFIAVPDGPLMLFTALFLWCYKTFTEKNNWTSALLMGICLAALAYSKYHGALVFLFTILSNLKLLKNPKSTLQTWMRG